MSDPNGRQETRARRFASWSRLLRRMAITGLGALGLVASVEGPASGLGRQAPPPEPTLESRNRRGKVGKLVLRLGGSGLKRSPGHGSHRSHSSHSSHSSHASHYSGSGSPSPAPRPRSAPRSAPAPLYVPPPPAPPVAPNPLSGESAHLGIDTKATLETIDRNGRKVTAKLASGLSQEFSYAPTVEIVVHTPEEVKVRLDQFLALAPGAFPLRVGQKVVIHWTYQERQRTALRFTIDSEPGKP